MVELIVIWAISIVAFFVLWAFLLIVIKRISEKKEQGKTELLDEPANSIHNL